MNAIKYYIHTCMEYNMNKVSTKKLTMNALIIMFIHGIEYE